MTARNLGTHRLPNVDALPTAGRPGRKVWFAGAEWTDDGTKWSKAGGSTSAVRVVLNVGTRGRREFTTTVAADVAVGDRVTGWLDYQATPAKAADEFEMDAVDVWCAVRTAGQLTIRLTGLTGPIAGEFPVDYLTAKG